MSKTTTLAAAVAATLPPFVLIADPVVEWPVRVQIPLDGGFQEQEFIGRFRVLPEEAFAALFPDRKPAELAERLWTDVLTENAKAIPQVLVGWNVRDEKGKPVSIHVLPELLVGPYGKWLAAGLRTAIMQIRVGIPATRTPGATEGNSQPAPDTGSGAQAESTAEAATS